MADFYKRKTTVLYKVKAYLAWLQVEPSVRWNPDAFEEFRLRTTTEMMVGPKAFTQALGAYGLAYDEATRQLVPIKGAFLSLDNDEEPSSVERTTSKKAVPTKSGKILGKAAYIGQHDKPKTVKHRIGSKKKR